MNQIFDEVVTTWSLELGGKLTKDRQKSIIALADLFMRLQSQGYQPHEIIGREGRGKIMKVAVHQGYLPPRKRMLWMAVVKDRIDMAAQMVWNGKIRVKDCDA